MHALGYAAESAENGVEALDQWNRGVLPCSSRLQHAEMEVTSSRYHPQARVRKPGKRIPIIAARPTAGATPRIPFPPHG